MNPELEPAEALLLIAAFRHGHMNPNQVLSEVSTTEMIMHMTKLLGLDLVAVSQLGKSIFTITEKGKVLAEKYSTKLGEQFCRDRRKKTR